MHLIESLKELILLCSSFQRKFKSSLSGQCSTCKTVTMWLKNLLEKESIHMGIGNGSDTYFNVLHCASLLLMVWCIHMFVFLACMKYVQDIGTFMKTVVSTQISCLYISDAWFLNGSLPPHPWYVVDQSKSLLIAHRGHVIWLPRHLAHWNWNRAKQESSCFADLISMRDQWGVLRCARKLDGGQPLLNCN